MPSSTAPGVAPALGLQQLGKTHEPAGQFPNRHVPGAREYYPLTEPSVGTALSSVVCQCCSIWHCEIAKSKFDIAIEGVAEQQNAP